jgi:hypothetical protein
MSNFEVRIRDRFIFTITEDNINFEDAWKRKIDINRDDINIRFMLPTTIIDNISVVDVIYPYTNIRQKFYTFPRFYADDTLPDYTPPTPRPASVRPLPQPTPRPASVRPLPPPTPRPASVRPLPQPTPRPASVRPLPQPTPRQQQLDNGPSDHEVSDDDYSTDHEVSDDDYSTDHEFSDDEPRRPIRTPRQPSVQPLQQPTPRQPSVQPLDHDNEQEYINLTTLRGNMYKSLGILTKMVTENLSRRRRYSTPRSITDELVTDETRRLECKICLTNKISVALTKCGHTFCNSCTNRFDNKCAVCRTKFNHMTKARIFL